MESYIVVPINEQGVWEYENDSSKRDNLEVFVLPKSEMSFIFREGIVDTLNAKFSIFIDEYEEEVIENKWLNETAEMIEKYKASLPVFYHALTLAREKNTELGLELFSF